MDKISREKRSNNMSKIRGKDTSIEVITRKWLFSKGFRFRKNDKRLPGKPDIVLPKYHTVIFIHGCFWHGHGFCNYSHIPKTRTDFWISKINNNINRDKINIDKLCSLGWNVIVLWECELKKNLEDTMNKLINDLKNSLP